MTAPRATKPETIHGPIQPLTKTESRVADGVFRHLTYREIGVELASLEGRDEPVSEHTVRVHVNNIGAKLEGCESQPPRARVYFWMLRVRFVEDR